MPSVEDGRKCTCPICTCGNEADLDLGRGPVCGCCAADCPDVHGEEGKTWRRGYWVRPVPWRLGWELHVDGVGVTQCTELAEAEETTRDFLASMTREDASTARVHVLQPVEPSAGN